MNQYPQAFIDLMECFKTLPGIGKKGAERLVYHVLNQNEQYAKQFADAFIYLHDNIHYCKTCGMITDHEICELCLDTERDRSMICVVEKPQDVFAMEKVKAYKGLYHVLNGAVSIMNGISIDDLNINSLFERLDENVKEVIIATNPTRDGETTALYLSKLLEEYPVKVTRIAHGLPIGSNIDYADELTLLKSLEGRTKI